MIEIVGALVGLVVLLLVVCGSSGNDVKAA